MTDPDERDPESRQKMKLSSAELREWLKFIRETAIALVLLIVAIITGTWLMSKREYDHKTLSKYSIPTARPYLEMGTPNTNFGGNICTINGRYVVENTGDMPWIINGINIEVFPLLPAQASEVPDNINGEFLSRTLDNYLIGKKPFPHEKILTKVMVGPGGEGSRVFELVFRVPDSYIPADNPSPDGSLNLIVRASAKGGRAKQTGDEDLPYIKDDEYVFGENELSTTVTTRQCVPPVTSSW